MRMYEAAACRVLYKRGNEMTNWEARGKGVNKWEKVSTSCKARNFIGGI